MPTQKKIDTVADLKERLERATLLASADYRGLRVKEMVEMRRRLGEAAIEVRVVKNTLLRLAANESGQPELLEIIEGPTALAISYGDAIGADVVQAINEAYEANTVREEWQAGDLLLVDNLRTAHGREPFEGPREVVVAMADAVRVTDGSPTIDLVVS